LNKLEIIMSKEKKKELKDYSADLLSLESHLMKAVKKQKTSDRVKDSDAIDLLHEIDKTLSEQVMKMESHVNRLGGELMSDLKEKLATFTGSVAGMIDNFRTDPTSKILRDDYTALSMLSIGYTMLHTVALANDDSLLAELTDSHLSELTQLVAEVSRVIPLVVARETIEDPVWAEEIGKIALENTQEAWAGENIKEGPSII
jgi:hypothetical protein